MSSLFSKKSVVVEPLAPPLKADPEPVVQRSSAPWLDKALEMKGLSEHSDAGKKLVPEMHAVAGLSKSDQKPSTAWCGSAQVWNFVVKLGLPRDLFPKSASWARSWSWKAGWGTKLSEPKYGAFINLERNAPGGDSHITVFHHKDSNGNWVCFGGNQGDHWTFSTYSPKGVLAVTWPPKGVLVALGL
jgi:uncharacterized protein (TIGR02594 family)